MRRIYRTLPGPTPVKVATSIVLVCIALVALHFFYEWVGSTFLDTGGTVG
ncbi:MAG: hypothetical protein HKN91_13490 [Acidimicrobiia bacterium]|nr:hypothetical protein [Acidimicrobiia bacterium]